MGSFKPRLLLSVVYTLVVSKHFGLGAFNHFVLNNLHVSCNIQTKHLNYKIYKFHQFLKIVFKDKIFQYPRPKYSIPHEFILPTRTKSILSTLQYFSLLLYLFNVIHNNLNQSYSENILYLTQNFFCSLKITISSGLLYYRLFIFHAYVK